MKFDPKVVPFDRGADFVYQRAMKNRRDNNMVDALELMRKAVEASPENDAYRLDFAELLSDAGCHIQSNQVLLDMLAKGVNEDECLYSLAINQLNLNDAEGAKKLLRMCVEKGRRGEVLDQARALSGEIEMYEELSRPMTRRIERMTAMADTACSRLRADDLAGAKRLFERVLKMDRTQRDVRALLGMTYVLMGKREEGLREAKTAIMQPGETLRSLCVAGQVFGMAGEKEQARDALQRACEFDCDPLERRMLVYALFEMNVLEEARGQCQRLIRETPCDRQLLHAMAVICIKMGEEPAKAARFWRRILRIDPDDTIADYYMDAAVNGVLDKDELTCEYQVPRSEMIARYRYIAEKLEGDLVKLGDEWKNNARLRALIGWCLLSDDKRFHEAAVTLLSSVDDTAAESLMREYLLRPGTGFDLTLRAAAMYRLRGEDINRILPPYAAGDNGLIPDGDRVLEGMSVGHRQLVRLANDILEHRYDIYAYDHLAVMWDVYRRSRPLHTDPLVKTEAAAGALAYCYLALMQKEPSFYKLSAQFGCADRQLIYFARHMATVLEKANGVPGMRDK